MKAANRIFLTGLLFFGFLFFPSFCWAEEHHAYPGDNLQNKINGLSAGDVLNLHGGTYYQTGITVSVDGTPANPIIIQSAPGERAWVSGGLVPGAESALNDSWELVDSNLGLYRTRQSVSYDGNLGGWLIDPNVQLMRYSDYNRLVSTSDDYPDCYMGPGVHGRNSRVYIRLQPNQNDKERANGEPISSLPVDDDPNQNRIIIFSANRIFLFIDANNIVLRNLDIGPSKRPIELTNSNDIEIANCLIRLKTLGIYANNDGTTSGLDIHDNEVIMGFPEWIYWGDIKGSWKPAYDSGWNSFSISGCFQNSRIYNNVLRDSFDGISLGAGSSNTQVFNNTIIRSRDDAVDLSPVVSNVEVAHNLFRHCFTGISLNGATGTNGEAFIHHNVIDISSLHRGNRDGDEAGGRDYYDVWARGNTFGNHGCGGRCENSRWRIYNNTIIGKNTSRFTPIGWLAGNHIMYNNLILSIGSGTFSGLSNSAGNAFWRTQGGLTGFSEPEGIEVDPGLNVAVIEEFNYNPAADWERYRPIESQIFTPGYPYPGHWPGIVGVAYRGALGPSGGPTATPLPSPSLTPTPTVTLTPALPVYDLDNNGVVDAEDFLIALQDWGAGEGIVDVNDDQKVNVLDGLLILQNYS